MPPDTARPSGHHRIASSLWLLLAASLLLLAPVPQAAAVDYLDDVKPILQRRCYSCHAALQQRSDLRLDTAANLLAGGKRGPAALPGQPKESLLLAAVTGRAGFRMPPPDAGEPLTAEEIEVLRAWIEQGAVAPQDEAAEDPRSHWSYQPPSRPAVPQPTRVDWVRNPIDAFVAAEHERRQLEAEPAAEPHVLLRRVYLDLIGLPPTRRQLQRFLADPSDAAYEAHVDLLLASPEYGQRWGRHWMDVWRYSDWYGRRQQAEIRYSQRHIWRWRDWIIDSLNKDKGYDQMVLEMLAGDEVAPGDPDVLRATGLLGRNWYKFDRDVWLRETVEHTSMGLLAVTLKCARCHDHKFDPVTQKEYYQYRAFFEPHDVRLDPVDDAADPEKQGLARVFDAKPDAPTYLFLRGDDRHPDKDHPLSPAVPAAFGVPLPEVQPVELPLEAYVPVAKLQSEAAQAVKTAETAQQQAAADLEAQRQLLADVVRREQRGGAADDQEPVVILADDFAQADAGRWKTLSGDWQYQDERLRQTAITSFATMQTVAEHPRNFRARVRYRTLPGGTYRSVGVFFDMVGSRDAQAVYTSANDERPSVQAFHRQEGREQYPQKGIVPCDIAVGQEVLLELEVRGQQLMISVDGQKKLEYEMPMPRQAGHFALWVHNGTAEFLELKIEELPATRADVQSKVVDAERRLRAAELKVEVARAAQDSLLARIAATRAAGDDSDDAPQLAMQAAAAEKRAAIAAAELKLIEAQQQMEHGGDSKLVELVRESEKQLDMVRAAPSDNFTPLTEEYPRQSTGRRLALARWMIDPRNPRTSRVAVNHVWLRHFGQALVPSVANFGLSGQDPSHPELLDWLSIELMENGWSMKHLHRLIVTSSTYRLASTRTNVQNLSEDADNRYLWRMNARRMEAEVVRDSMLHLAAALDTQLGGPELDPELAVTSPRRSLYFRTTPDDNALMLDIFDLANPNECYQRQHSVVPQQALALNNSALALTQARRIARQLDSDDDFIAAAFQTVLARTPTRQETERCRQFLAEHAQLLGDRRKLTPFPAAEVKPLPPAETPQQRARENLVHVLLNHNDFVTIR